MTCIVMSSVNMYYIFFVANCVNYRRVVQTTQKLMKGLKKPIWCEFVDEKWPVSCSILRISIKV